MSFSSIFSSVATNVGVSKEWIFLLIVMVGSIIFMAKDFKIGLLVLMVTTASLFVWFYEQNLNWVLPFVVFIACLVIMALSLFAVNKSSTTGGFT